MPSVMITGWKTGFNKVECTKTLRALPGFGLNDAKKITDAVLDGQTQVIRLSTLAEAQSLATKLEKLGAVVRIDL
jgi:ribosomal protein L7/L12